MLPPTATVPNEKETDAVPISKLLSLVACIRISPFSVVTKPLPKVEDTSLSITTTFKVPPTVFPLLLVEIAAAMVHTWKSVRALALCS